MTQEEKDKAIDEMNRLSHIVYGCNQLLEGLEFYDIPITNIIFERQCNVPVRKELHDALREPLLRLIKDVRNEAMKKIS